MNQFTRNDSNLQGCQHVKVGDVKNYSTKCIFWKIGVVKSTQDGYTREAVVKVANAERSLR